jgi:adenylate cyclase
MTRREYRRLALILALSALLALILSVALANGALSTLQAASQDFFFFTFEGRGVKHKTDSVVIVAIDDRSMKELNRRFGEWPRTYYARVVDRLREGPARGIVFDVGFVEPHPDDEEVGAALSRFASMSFEELRAAGATGSPRIVISPRVGAPAYARRLQPGSPPIYPDLIDPQPAYLQASTALGHVNQIPDEDGSIRSLPLLIQVDGQDIPALSLVAAAAYTDKLRSPIYVDQENGGIMASGRFIPTNAISMMIISFAGPPSPIESPDSQTFHTVSFVDVMEGRIPPATFRDKMVFLGLHDATGLMDAFQVPTSRDRSKMPGVEIHANAFVTIVSPRFFAPQQVPVTMAIVVFFCFATGLVIARFAILGGSVAVILAIALYFLGSLEYATRSWDPMGVALPNLVYPPLALVATFVTTAVARVIFEQAETRATRGALGKYLSPAILDAVMRDPDQLRLGGEKRVMTVLFTDIRGFTTFSESLDPERLVPLLNEYLGVMTNVVHRWQGVLDKYMGDAIMAWWGAPVDQPDHAYRACMAALEMRAQLHVLHERWAAAGIPLLEMGIGINTGPMVYGNTGSAERFDFTVLGDAVNLASRLEGANKEYGSNVIAAGATLDSAGDGRFVARFLDMIEVKGKTQPAEIYELLGVSDALDPTARRLATAWEAAIELYRARDFSLAEQAFRRILDANPTDGPARVYLERCEALRQNPPAADWDGVFVMTHK